MPVVTTPVNSSMPPFYVIAMDGSGHGSCLSGSVQQFGVERRHDNRSRSGGVCTRLVSRNGRRRCGPRRDVRSHAPTVRRDQFGVYEVLESYFAGAVGALDTLTVEARGTEFQQDVWRQLRRIEVGSTISYGELALRVGRPNAQRAVGMANASNPIALIVPCHRVIRTGGALGGY